MTPRIIRCQLVALVQSSSTVFATGKYFNKYLLWLHERHCLCFLPFKEFISIDLVSNTCSFGKNLNVEKVERVIIVWAILKSCVVSPSIKSKSWNRGNVFLFQTVSSDCANHTTASVLMQQWFIDAMCYLSASCNLSAALWKANAFWRFKNSGTWGRVCNVKVVVDTTLKSP